MPSCRARCWARQYHRDENDLVIGVRQEPAREFGGTCIQMQSANSAWQLTSRQCRRGRCRCGCGGAADGGAAAGCALKPGARLRRH
eukprot:6152631-Pleurochrysis_carterae.AAC.3